MPVPALREDKTRKRRGALIITEDFSVAQQLWVAIGIAIGARRSSEVSPDIRARNRVYLLPELHTEKNTSVVRAKARFTEF